MLKKTLIKHGFSLAFAECSVKENDLMEDLEIMEAQVAEVVPSEKEIEKQDNLQDIADGNTPKEYVREISEDQKRIIDELNGHMPK